MLKFLAIVTLILEISSATVSARCASGEKFIGTLEIFEFSSFISGSGEIFSVRIEGDEAKKIISNEIKNHDKSHKLCLKVRFIGSILENSDFHGRRVVEIRKFDHLESEVCT